METMTVADQFRCLLETPDLLAAKVAAGEIVVNENGIFRVKTEMPTLRQRRVSSTRDVPQAEAEEEWVMVEEGRKIM